MRFRPWLTLAALLIVTAPVQADDHRADLYWGFSYAEGSQLWGLHQSAAWQSSLADRRLSLVGDLSVHVGSRDGSDATRVTYLVGPRYTVRVEGTPQKVHLYFLGGGVRTTDGTEEGANRRALAFGAAWEIFPSEFLGNKRESLEDRKWGFHLQADYVVTSGDDFPRISGGITFRFQ